MELTGLLIPPDQSPSLIASGWTATSLRGVIVFARGSHFKA